MEVHHHPDLHHKEKSFKEFFLEFVMIFLAVTLGFIAENIREHFTEKENAKEYAKLLLNDLTADTVEFNRTAHVLNRIINAGDSLSDLITSGNIKNIPTGKLYYDEYWSGWQWRVTSRDATLNELESSGALRYLGKITLVKKILDYEESLKIITLLENNNEQGKAANWKLVQKVFDGRYFKSLDRIKSASLDSSSSVSMPDTLRLHQFMNTNFPLITYDKNTLIELSNWAVNSSRSYQTFLRTVDFAKKRAIEVIEDLNKEYRF